MADRSPKPNWAEKVQAAASVAQTLQLESIRRAQQQSNRIQEGIAHTQLTAAALAAAQLAERQSEARFKRDLEWLVASDAAGRCEYLLRQNRSDIIESIYGTVLSASKLEETP